MDRECLSGVRVWVRVRCLSGVRVGVRVRCLSGVRVGVIQRRVDPIKNTKSCVSVTLERG